MKLDCHDTSLYDKVMESLPERRFRCHLDIPRNKIIVRGPATHVHEAPNVFFHNLQPLLQEWMGELGYTGNLKFLGAPACNIWRNGKQIGHGKAADICFGIAPADKNKKESLYPEIIIEVGYTETWAELLEDARTWILDTGGCVQCVILVKYTKPANDKDFNKVEKWQGQIAVYHR